MARHDWLTLSPDGKQLATFYPWSGDNNGEALGRRHAASPNADVDPQKLNRVISVISAEFSPDGKLLAAGFQFQWVTVWDVATGKVKLQFQKSRR